MTGYVTTESSIAPAPRTPAARGPRPPVVPGAGPDVEPAVESVLLDQLLRERSVWPVLQPIVELETGAPAGYEALARGPAEHPLHAPAELFGAARRAGRLADLDMLCRRRALETAFEAGLYPPAVLFVNVEPGGLGPEPGAGGPEPDPTLARLRERGVHVVAELTERALTDDPGRLLAFAERMRALGCGIALDDLGAEPLALALMPLLAPDVIKLDLRVVQNRPDAVVAQTMTAVTAHAEADAATIVAEGVENAEHEATARSLGASHGQGWRYGAPAPPEPGMFARSALWRPIVPRTDRARVPDQSVFALASRGRTPLQGTKALLIEISLLLERQAADLGGLAVVLSTFEEDHHFGRAVRERYAALAERAAFVAALGAGIPPEPAPGVRGADLAPGDPVRAEWDIVVVGPHFAVALVARDVGDTGPEPDRRFDYVLTYDRACVLESARSLLGRVGPRAA